MYEQPLNLACIYMGMAAFAWASGLKEMGIVLVRWNLLSTFEIDDGWRVRFRFCFYFCDTCEFANFISHSLPALEGKNGCLDEGRYVWGKGSALASHFGVGFEPLGYEIPWLPYDVQGLALPIVGKEVPRAWREAFLATTEFVYSYQMMKENMRMGSILDTVQRLLMWIETFRLEMLVPTRQRHMMSASVSIPTESPNAGFMSEPSTISSLPSATLL